MFRILYIVLKNDVSTVRGEFTVYFLVQSMEYSFSITFNVKLHTTT